MMSIVGRRIVQQVKWTERFVKVNALGIFGRNSAPPPPTPLRPQFRNALGIHGSSSGEPPLSHKGFGVQKMGNLWSRCYSKGSKRSKKKKSKKGSTEWLNINADDLGNEFRKAYQQDYDDCLLVGLEKVKSKFQLVNDIEEGVNQNREEFVLLVHQVKEKEQLNTYNLRTLMRKAKDGTKLIFTVTIGDFCRTITVVTIATSTVKRKPKVAPAEAVVEEAPTENAFTGLASKEASGSKDAIETESTEASGDQADIKKVDATGEETQKEVDIEEGDEVDIKKVDVKVATGEETEKEEFALKFKDPKEKAQETAHPPPTATDA